MPHLWVRAESRAYEERVGLTPEGAAHLLAQGFRVTVEESRARAIPVEGYRAAGCTIVPEGSWPAAPREAIVFGLKELPEDGSPLVHRHIMFGHAFKGQSGAAAFLERFRSGGGALLDLEYLVDDTGRRLAAFGYWAGYAGAAVSLMAWAAQQEGRLLGPVAGQAGRDALLADLRARLGACGAPRPRCLIIGALGRVGTGAGDLCAALDLPVTRWDMAETAHGGPFPEVLDHEVFLNCILAGPATPVFVPRAAKEGPRRLRVIGDIACDPTSDFNPVPVYDRATSFDEPVLRVHDAPPLDVMAIDNLPSMLPVESSEDYAAQLLPVLAALADPASPVWARARAVFDRHLAH